jgi:hypothetical protein
MFIAEPARNAREWVVGLMMLDLIGEEYSAATSTRLAKHYLMDSVLAHPDRISRTEKGGDAPDKAQKGPSGQRYHWDRGTRVDDRQSLVSVSKVSELAKVEGKYPASPGGSAATSVNVDVANDYIQMKEVSVVSRCVARRLTNGTFKDLDSWSASAIKAGTPRTDRSEMKIVAQTATSPSKKGCAQEILDEIKSLISNRASSFD